LEIVSKSDLNLYSYLFQGQKSTLVGFPRSGWKAEKGVKRAVGVAVEGAWAHTRTHVCALGVCILV